MDGGSDGAGWQSSLLSFLVDFSTTGAETLQSNKRLTGERKERAA